MKKIFGRVLVKETNSGIPNLVVAAFDQDRPAHEVVGGGQEAPSSVLLGRLGDRLGSVLTDNEGNFAIETERCEPAGADTRPDLTLVVFAPEDALTVDQPAPLSPEDRVLHVSLVPRNRAGMVEAYVIRLLQAQLDKFHVPSGVPLPAQRDGEAEAARFLASVEQAWGLRDKLNAQLAPRLARRAERARVIRNQAKEAVKDLSAVPAARRSDPLFVKAGEPVTAAQEAAARAGLERLNQYQEPLVLNLKPEELESLGLRLVDGQVEGTVTPSALVGRMLAPTGGTDLVRARSLVQACAPAGAPPAGPSDTPPVIPIAASPLAVGDGDGAGVARLTDADAEQQILDRVLGQLKELTPADGGGLAQRPDLTAIQQELDAIKLKGGPADATAFHDFHVLQVAFKHVWAEAFDERLRGLGEALYDRIVHAYDEAGLEIPPFDAIADVDALRELIQDVQRAGFVPPTGTGAPLPRAVVVDPSGQSPTSVGLPTEVRQAFPEAQQVWDYLSNEQRMFIQQQAGIVNGSGPQGDKDRAKQVVAIVLSQPEGPGGRLATLILELGRALNEPYAFDVFAPYTYNFGVMLTYRQRWEPLQYQAGDLVATIPLAPGETRRYSKKRVVKKTRAEREIEKSMSSRAEQSSQTSRAEDEIMKKAATATNFKMTASGSFNVGIGSIDASSQFALDQAQESASNKKEFHEATVKAAEEYRRERSMEVDVTAAEEVEETSSGEISNPNNELTVTYLFYELQRRYRISEQIYRARPVILVAQEVPAPHEIDEAWLIENQWILARVLLDDSFRPALDYLTSGMAGDEVSLEVLNAHWKAQQELAKKLENQVSRQLSMRDALRDTLVQTALNEELAKAAELPTVLKVVSLDLADPAEKAADQLEAQRKAAETRLQYAEEALADAQKKLAQATDALEQATREYATALQKQFSRHVAIDQLRIHVKQNILYYMQAIWDHEPPDQRFFRLYRKQVMCPDPADGCSVQAVQVQARNLPLTGQAHTVSLEFSMRCAPAFTEARVDLEEIADLDNPLGYKGNYVIFPLKQPCYLTSFMLREFVHDYFGVRDPDELGDYTIEELEQYVSCVLERDDVPQEDKDALQQRFIERLTEARRSSDEIIVPTGQLFVEALPGSHALLEDFKLLHRVEDVRKVRAEVRHAEMENLRLAARVVNKKLGDPDVEKKVVIDGKTSAIDVSDG